MKDDHLIASVLEIPRLLIGFAYRFERLLFDLTASHLSGPVKPSALVDLRGIQRFSILRDRFTVRVLLQAGVLSAGVEQVDF